MTPTAPNNLESLVCLLLIPTINMVRYSCNLCNSTTKLEANQLKSHIKYSCPNRHGCQIPSSIEDRLADLVVVLIVGDLQ